ncbi:MAG TPA: hypothetical protein VIF57_09885, partial [Polyangia bacterium]
MTTGRGSWVAIAFTVAIGASPAARAATPAAHVVRIDRAGDGRLDALASAVRAELLAAGFKVAPASAGARSGEAAAESAVITLTLDGARALVVVTADGTASSFSAEIAFADAGAARRDVNQVALQVAEWLAAIWLPPPASTRAAPPSTAVIEPVVPPPVAAAPAPPVAPATAAATLRALPASPPAAFRMMLLDFGAGVLRAPAFGSQFGFEAGAALHGISPIVLGATPFARLGLGLYWLGRGLGSSSPSTDVNFASLTVTGGLRFPLAGLRFPLAEKLSVEASAGIG